MSALQAPTQYAGEGFEEAYGMEHAEKDTESHLVGMVPEEETAVGSHCTVLIAGSSMTRDPF